MNGFVSSVKNWTRLPRALKFIWLVIGVGVALLGWGYLNHITSMSWTGLGVFVAGYAGGVFHGWGREDASTEASSFYLALLVSPIAGAVFCALSLVVAVLFFIGVAIFGDFEWGGVLRILHFIGIMFCACIFISLPGSARKVVKEGEVATEEGGAEEESGT